MGDMMISAPVYLSGDSTVCECPEWIVVYDTIGWVRDLSPHHLTLDLSSYIKVECDTAWFTNDIVIYKRKGPNVILGTDSVSFITCDTTFDWRKLLTEPVRVEVGR